MGGPTLQFSFSASFNEEILPDGTFYGRSIKMNPSTLVREKDPKREREKEMNVMDVLIIRGQVVLLPCQLGSIYRPLGIINPDGGHECFMRVPSASWHAIFMPPRIHACIRRSSFPRETPPRFAHETTGFFGSISAGPLDI